MQLKFFIFFLSLLTTSMADNVRQEIKTAKQRVQNSRSLVDQLDFQSHWTEDGKALIVKTTVGNQKQYKEIDLASGRTTVLKDNEKLQKRMQVSATLLSPVAIKRQRGHGGKASTVSIDNQTKGPIELFWLNHQQRKSYGRIEAGKSYRSASYHGHRWLVTDGQGKELAGFSVEKSSTHAVITGPVNGRTDDSAAAANINKPLSPDGKWKALIVNHNLHIISTQDGRSISLTSDGTDQAYYRGPFLWSPDSSKLLVHHQLRTKVRKIHFVEASPKGRVQPKLHTLNYNKAGDPIAPPKPRLFDIQTQKQVPLDDKLYSNPWSIRALHWAADSSAFFFAYNQRGHQVMRLVRIEAANGKARNLFEDRSITFIDYSQKFHLTHIPASKEIIWASERSGHNHLYLLNEETGAIKSTITSGDWNVFKVVSIDTEKRSLLIQTIGLNPASPYYKDFIQVGFDGSEFRQLSKASGNHSIEFSPDQSYFIDSWSRVDHPPVRELRRSHDGSLVTELSRADDSRLSATGWSRPERFVAKGRDGKTDIHGVIIKPSDFDPKLKYPVIECIYAGPHGFFTPQDYRLNSVMRNYAELGFVLVQIDGMGTNWRNKAFHDVCWKNLSDAGFPDRKLWIREAAKSRPWMDLSRVGIFGGSAGGQSTVAALLHHGDFYHAGVADCGCHDNRIDKIWWNEAWMGWPVDKSYAENSNVTHADKLKGKLLLIYGEVDSNVDPASTAQLAAALQRAGKFFEYMPIMGANHGAAESSYGNYRRAEFFIRQLEPAKRGMPNKSQN
ncbi:prolyl oligopeptidase family serine peptidase [Verrucomicrobiaceae bacterium N1E253]|uniref:Prolyl oligopeptidase family serine peptidase n=1 Tax=Oceaniferula marina TaxID=2748318 RepID=A0A851GAN2_9BACT|nr:DPP IV N-terminal domain-containing protein [Oceaniferula marina]NWK54466.1 prolyl oligopeptidase family serine peptidase [Oceaniferula marina]